MMAKNMRRTPKLPTTEGSQLFFTPTSFVEGIKAMMTVAVPVQQEGHYRAVAAKIRYR